MISPSLLPAPLAMTTLPAGAFTLDDSVSLSGDAAAVATLSALITARTGLTLTGSEATGSEATGPAITLRISSETDAGAPESYTLTADAASVVVTGADGAGLFYGVQSLVQLVTASNEGWVIPGVIVTDAPRFAYRGVMLDVARHFHPVEVVKAYIDRAAGLKFNVLHLHLSDDQGWRLELTSRPALTQKASATSVGGDPGGFYTQDEYRDIIAYADAAHMIVVPEIDVPGHTHTVSLAYPELSEEPVLSDHIREIAAEYGGALPVNGVAYDGMAVGFSSLKIHDDATYAFLADVFGEVAALTPGPYVHVGGDEALGTSAEDFTAFMGRVTALVSDLGKTPIAWHEAGAAGTGLAADTIGQYWGYMTPIDGMDAKARAFVTNGAQLILSPADAIYLDMKFDEHSPLGLTWARGVTSAQRAYEWDPADVIDGVGDEDVLGIEAPLWTETVTSLSDIDHLAFPRIAAAAEAAWSPAVGASELRTWESFRERVGATGPLWTALGIDFSALPEIEWAQR